jgi:hypothetical protein
MAVAGSFAALGGLAYVMIWGLRGETNVNCYQDNVYVTRGCCIPSASPQVPLLLFNPNISVSSAPYRLSERT